MKTLLITGAARGTGLAIARRFLQSGYGVYLTSRRGEEAEETARELAAEFQLPVRGLKLDPAEGEAGVTQLFAEIPQLDVLVLNAADMGVGANPLTVELADWAEVIQTNVIWNFNLARTAARLMKERGGSILFIGSNTGRRAIGERSAYIASKGALSALTRALAVDLADYRIRVNNLLPGVIATERWNRRSAEDQQTRYDRIPLAKAATFEEVAEAAFYLAHATQCTGTELVVDGGAEIKLW